jgi:hypothetical protein
VKVTAVLPYRIPFFFYCPRLIGFGHFFVRAHIETPNVSLNKYLKLIYKIQQKKLI